MIDEEEQYEEEMPPIILPEEAIHPQSAPEPKLRVDDLAYMFEVPQPEDNDMYTEDLITVDEEEDISDLINVGGSDLIGDSPYPEDKPKYRVTPRGRRVVRPYPPPTAMGGMR